MESEYDLVTSLMLLILSNGKSTMGSNATVANGIASNIHQLIINTAIDKTRLAFINRENGFTSKKNKKNTKPVIKPQSFLLLVNNFFIRFISIEININKNL